MLYDVRMQPTGANPDVYRRQAGLAVLALRDTYAMTQTQFAQHMTVVLERPVSRGNLSNMEKGRRDLSVADLLALADEAGWDIGELLSVALHRMIHGEWTQIQARKEVGRTSRLSDRNRRDRMATMVADLRQLHELQPPRQADAADHPPIEP